MPNPSRNSLRTRINDWNTPQNRILIGLMAPAVMTGMNHHTFGVALPAIRNDFGIDADTTAWVAMSYTLPFMMFMPLYGRLGDRLGKQRLLLFGTTVFLVGTILVMMANSLVWLIGGRFIQGAGSAGFVPLSIAIITQRFATEDRGRVMGAWNSIIPLTGLAFPFFAGLLVDLLGWRAIYPPLILAAVLAYILIQRAIQPLTRSLDMRYLREFDWVGVGLLSGALATLLFYTASRPITGVPALQDMRLLAIWPVLFGALIVWERRRLQPYINLSIFTVRTFSLSSLCAGLRMLLMTSISFLIPLYMSDVHASPASVIGIVLTLQAGMLFVTSRPGGQLADRFGSRLPVTVSLAGLIGVMVLLASLPATAPIWLIVVAAMAHGLLIGLSLAPLHRSAMQGIQADEVGMAAGLYSMIRFAGQILGTAIAGVLLQRGLERLPMPIDAYQFVFWVFAGLAVVATLAGTQLREEPGQ